jgi:site-specific DNA-methyltransferase (cytosine-N4-specific)
MSLANQAPAQKSTPAASRRFIDANWDFSDSESRRELHPYPARFIPEIPRQALTLLEVEGPVVDPFCGSGTTLHEATRLGLPAVGVDLNPIACLISRTRTHPWRRSDAARAVEESHNLHQHALEGGDFDLSSEDIPRIDHWFDPWAQEALAGAISYLRRISEPIWRDRIATAISSTVVRIGRQESDTRYAAVDKGGDRRSAATELARSVVRVCEWLSTNSPSDEQVDVEVHCRDARDLSQLATSAFAAAVFSPPYPNAYEYWLYHKYRMYWLGFDPLAVRAAELGARPHYCKPNGLTETDFAKQMSDVFAELRRALCSGAPTVIVIGDSIIGGRRVDNGKLLKAVAREQDFVTEAELTRSISGRRSSFNRAHSRGRDTEHLLLLRSP